jgi:AI-2 transport protein TqsA
VTDQTADRRTPDPSRMHDRALSQPALRRAMVWLLAVIVVILTGWALRATAGVMVPLVVGFFVALIVYPLDRMTQERMPPKLKWLGHIVAMAAVLAGVALFVSCLWLAAQQVAGRLPAASQSVSVLPGVDMEVPNVGFGLLGGEGEQTQGEGAAPPEGEGQGTPPEETNEQTNTVDLPPEAIADSEGGDSQGSGDQSLQSLFQQAAGSLSQSAAQWASGLAGTIVDTAGATLSGLVLVFFLTLLMLIEAPRWSAKLQSVTTRRTETETQEVLDVIAAKLRRYLLARTVLGLATSALYALWLWFFDIDLILVWALLVFLLNFIPTIGSLIGGVLPVIYAFFQKDFGTAMIIGAGVLAIEQVMGNFIDPRVQGKQVSVSPMVILVVLLLWGWIWGIMGALLAVPVTIALVIIFTHIDPMRPVALFLSNECDLDDLDEVADGER